MNPAPTIGPGDGHMLFDEIDTWVLQAHQADGSGVMDCDFESLTECAEALWMSSPFRWQPFDAPFSFLASTSLAGAGNPCFDLQCRVERARALGRFSALYADTVLIRDPFEDLLHEEDSLKIRADLLVTLEVLKSLRTEVEAGIIAFAPTDFPFCKHDLAKFREQEDLFWERISAANDLIVDDVFPQVEVHVKQSFDRSIVTLSRLEKFVPKNSIVLNDLFGEDHSRRYTRNRLTESEQRDIVQTFVIDPALIDLQFRHTIRWMYNVRYITDRPLDCEFLSLLDDPNRPAAPNMSHELPYIDGLDTETLLKLRKDEGEAFQVYRDRVKSLVDEGPLDARQFAEAFGDLVRPEINQIDRAVLNAKKMVNRKLREKLVFGTGMVTLGLAAGSVAPDVGAVISAFGGAKFGADLLASLNALSADPPEIRTNDFYFLWKARNIAR